MKKIFKSKSLQTILTGVLCLGLVFGAVCPAFAAVGGDYYTQSNGSGSWNNDGTTVLTYTVKDSYTVTIPADFNTDNIESYQQILASNVIIPSGYKLQVKISSANNWFVVDETDADNKLAYQIATSEGGAALANNDVVLSVNAGEYSNNYTDEKLYHKITGTATKSGVYKDTVTFAVSVVAQD